MSVRSCNSSASKPTSSTPKRCPVLLSPVIAGAPGCCSISRCGGRNSSRGKFGGMAILQFHHLGVAVQTLEPAVQTYQDLFGYRVLSGPFTDLIQKVTVCFLGKDGHP